MIDNLNTFSNTKGEDLTLEKIEEAFALLRTIPAVPPRIEIISNRFCIETVRRFPESKHRSRRLHKKLTKRLGEQTFTRPAAYMMQGKLVAHPDIIGQLVKESKIVRTEDIA